MKGVEKRATFGENDGFLFAQWNVQKRWTREKNCMICNY